MNCRRCHKTIEDTPYCPWCGAKQTIGVSNRTRANGTGTAYKRGRCWTARVTVGFATDIAGKRRQLYRTKGGFRSKVEALNYCPTLLNAPETRHAPFLLSYWESYSANEMEKLSESKRTAYQIAWNKLAVLKTRPVDSLSVSDLRETVGLSCPTYYPARDAKVLLTHLFRLAAADGWVNASLPSLIDLPKLTEREREPFTDDEQVLLWKAYERGDKNAAIPLIMIYTGMMTGELRRLSVSMIDLEHHQIIGVGIKTDTRKRESVILPEDICPVLDDIMDGASGLLYPITEQAFYDRYYKALRDAGITRKLTPYSCRHTTATKHTIDENTPPQIVMRIMRWSSTKMMDRYVHPSDAAAKDAANALKRPE